MPRGAAHLLALGVALALWASARGASAQRVHVVRPGDTLTRIARRYHVTLDSLTRLNHLRGSTVRAGQRLRIPPRGGWSQRRGRRYRVRAGDTVARIARRYHIRIADLRAANGLRGDTIRPGQRLLVPRPGQSGAALRASLREGRPPTVENPPVPEEIAQEAEARARELSLGPTHVAQRLLRQGAEPRWVAAAGSDAELEGTLLLPVEGGRFLRGWGSGTNGYHLAVDIGAPPGTTIRAAERGLVAYAGHGVRGYGNLVLLVHPNGWVSAYAHGRVLLVVPGEIVERGQPIAEVGSTGFARGPHLHFILVDEGEHCDPVPLFRPRIRRANGREPDGPTLTWDGDHRPSGIRCLRREERPNPLYHGGLRRGARRR